MTIYREHPGKMDLKDLDTYSGVLIHSGVLHFLVFFYSVWGGFYRRMAGYTAIGYVRCEGA